MTMRIGDLANSSGTPVATIRFYEREGLVPAPSRSEGNYRIYTRHHAERLAFIVQCRALDMTLDEVRVLLRFKDAPQADCAEVNELLDEHIGHVASRVRELRALERELRQLRSRCEASQPARDCGILTGLKEAAGTTIKPGSAKRHVRGPH
jgi:Cd(II)/Pb(II)-responsive transcriptional regulator